MRRLFLILTLLAGFSLLPFRVAAQSPEAAEQPPVEVRIVRDGENWTARFRFPEAAYQWAFQRSALQRLGEQPWRPESWRVTTPGVRLERIGRFDAFVTDEGKVPDEVAITFTPLAADLLADYDPAMIFSNGTVGLYTGHFHAFPMQGRLALAALERPRGYPSEVTLAEADGSPVLYRGQQWDSVTTPNEAYVLFGDVERAESALVATIFDPGLPEWMAQEMPGFNEETFTYYTARLGEHTQERPTILASWAGPTPELMSMGGSVTGNMVAMRLEGEGLLDPRPEVLERIQWFVAHEAAHFWMGQTVAYDDRRNAWISEGGADLMAYRLMQTLDLAADSEMHGLVDTAREECAALLANGGVQGAGDRNEHRANYACGMVFALAVEQAGMPRGQDFFTFAAVLMERYRGEGIGDAEWLAAAREFGLPQDKAALIAGMLREGASDGAAVLARLLDS